MSEQDRPTTTYLLLAGDAALVCLRAAHGLITLASLSLLDYMLTCYGASH